MKYVPNLIFIDWHNNNNNNNCYCYCYYYHCSKFQGKTLAFGLGLDSLKNPNSEQYSICISTTLDCITSFLQGRFEQLTILVILLMECIVPFGVHFSSARKARLQMNLPKMRLHSIREKWAATKPSLEEKSCTWENTSAAGKEKNTISSSLVWQSVGDFASPFGSSTKSELDLPIAT